MKDGPLFAACIALAATTKITIAILVERSYKVVDTVRLVGE